MSLLNSTLTTPELLGRLRHLWMAIGSVILGIGLLSPDWLPVIFSEGFVEIVFIVVGGVIDLVQILRSRNSPEKRMYAGRSVAAFGVSISPELAGTIRQLLTMLGMLLVVFKIPVPEAVTNALSEQGIQLLVDAIGLVITYISFVLSKNAEEKQVNEKEFLEMRVIK